MCVLEGIGLYQVTLFNCFPFRGGGARSAGLGFVPGLYWTPSFLVIFGSPAPSQCLAYSQRKAKVFKMT